MKEFFVLAPKAESETTKLGGWVLHDENRVESLSMSLSEIATQKPDRVTLVVPVTALSWHTLNLPKSMRKNDARLLPLMQSMLEDVLVDEADNAHIAIAPGAASGAKTLTNVIDPAATQVMVCDRTWLCGWVKAFTACSIRIARIAPEIDPSMAQAMGQAVLCSAHDYISYATITDAAGVSSLPLPEAAMFAPPDVPVYASAAAHSAAERAFGAERVKLLSELQYLELLKASTWDLAQHDLATTGWNRLKKQAELAAQSFLGTKQWQPARIACMALALVYGLGNAFLLYQSNQALSAKKASIHSTVAEAFPRLTVIIDPVFQAQRELDALKRMQGLQTTADFLPLVSMAGSVWQAKNALPKTLEYSDKALVLTGVNPTAAAAFVAQVKSKGYEATQSDTSVRVTGTK